MTTFTYGGAGVPFSTIERSRRADPLPHELRRFCLSQVRAKTSEEDTTLVGIEGYASVTESPYEIQDFMGSYMETISRGAFMKTLKEKDDVRLLFNHDGIPLARTKSGTLSLVEDRTGLLMDATLDSRLGVSNDVVIAIERGDLDEMSFAFKVTRQKWNDDYSERDIQEVQLFDVSVVTYPANPATSAKLRGVDFLLNNMSDEDVADLMERYAYKGASATAKKLALRRRQLARLELA